ncbi:MAG: DUF3999 domain-containing protein [Pseudomonadaceae bacterium]|jgi:hypothetical protein|nr:DUF3999 domain-containing protein [Pseudomonadaceae bacterium]
MSQNSLSGRWISLVAVAFSLLAPLASAQDAPADFRSQVPLTLSGEGPWYRLELPMTLHFAAQFADLRDARVFNAQGQAQAYALTLGRAEEREKIQQTAVKWFPLRGPKDAPLDASGIRVQRNSSGTLVEVTAPSGAAPAEEQLRGWLLDASVIAAPLEKLQLNWSGDAEGFQSFSIEASDDLQHWQSWGQGQIARMSFADEQLEQRSVQLPGERARYLRLLWLAPQQAPALTEAQLFSRTSDSLPAPMAWSAVLVPNSVKSGEFIWDLPLALPLERFKINLPQTNTLAPVQLYGRRDGKVQWQLLSRSLLYRLPQTGKPEVESVQNVIELYGAPVQQLKLVVDQRGGGLGTEAPQLQVGMRATELVFLARGTPPYTLALGNAGAKAANLALTTLIPGFQPERLSRLGLATVSSAVTTPDSPVVVASVASGPDWKRIGLWAVLLLGVGLLVLMALSLLRAAPAKS